MDKVIAGLALGVLALPIVFLLSGVVSLVVAWPVMLFLGNASIASDSVIPALGYWPTFWLTWALSVVTARPTASSN